MTIARHEAERIAVSDYVLTRFVPCYFAEYTNTRTDQRVTHFVVENQGGWRRVWIGPEALAIIAKFFARGEK